MSQSFEDTRAELIERVVNHVIKKLSPQEVPLVQAFIRQYYLSVSPEDLSSRSVLDLYGAVVSHWHHILNRMPGEAKVRVFNPQLEQHGWQSTHTVIEIAHEDIPFIIDSIRMFLNRQELTIHLMIHMGGMRFIRDKKGKVDRVLPLEGNDEDGAISEVPIYIEIDRQSNEKQLKNIREGIIDVLKDINQVVSDWEPMRDKLLESIKETKKSPSKKDAKSEQSEFVSFLEWLAEDHFTFLAYRYYDYGTRNGEESFNPVTGSELGLKKTVNHKESSLKFSQWPVDAQELFRSSKAVLIGKTDNESTVHRPAYTDFVYVKKFDDKGQVIGVHSFIGLYTAQAYNSSPKTIPLLRRKVSNILAAAGFPRKSHDNKCLLNILENLPRDDLFHGTDQELYQVAIGILHLQERQRISLFIRKDTYGRYYSCLVFVPRETFNSELRVTFQDILTKALKGSSVLFTTKFSESTLARIHFVIRTDSIEPIDYDLIALERKLIESARTWQDDLHDALVDHCGEEKSVELFRTYGNAFPSSYRENFTARMAVIDIEHIESLKKDGASDLAMSLYHPLEEADDTLRFKLIRDNKPFPLSDIVPMLENMGLRIISERPYMIRRSNNTVVWINDYRMVHPKGESLNTETVKDIFQDAFAAIWSGKAENDGFNMLVLSANLSWRDISILRAYHKYLWQTQIPFSQNYVEEALYNNSALAKKLVKLFYLRFNPMEKASDEAQLKLKEKIEHALESVHSLSEDRIIRLYIDVMFATLRTNFFQKGLDGCHKEYTSFKLESAKVPELPLPLPLYEIFVYSPRTEGVHLRGAKVARGGLRWSDRREDFRTEVLGLMKAQQVKNAVIVPLGAKGGFVVKNLPEGSRDEVMKEVVYCYQCFIKGMLDITDNQKGDSIIPPIDVVRHDEDDPYLVVAADKGTATFSDIANAISQEYGFWMGDGFASGGCTGYDHKKMGITAKGAWESVKLHFKKFGHDVQTTPLTVIGIGDMGGDVFGNGMLLSNQIRLLGAYNHMHIFIDPNPDPATSYEERKRLFELPRSSWTDYNEELISQGGGVFWRSAKSIPISPEMKTLLGISNNTLTPNDLIKALLKSQVDLIWNGGIGTFVKATSETHADAGDRSNDAIRVNATELNARVIGEGGNLGLTQLARIQYAQRGGVINTDAIDNSAGVNCSDIEVSIKVLLNDVFEAGDITEKQRNELLAKMTDEVSELVLNNNRRQNEAISVVESQAARDIEMHHHLIKALEREADLDRVIEFLPDKEEISIRKNAGKGLTRPEIAVIMAYSKIHLKKELLDSSVPEEPYIYKQLEYAFPVPLRQKYHHYMERHRLKREIICTQISNAVINEMGMNFVHRLKDETGGSAADIVLAYTVAKEAFDINKVRQGIFELPASVPTKYVFKMMQELNRLIRRATRWFVRNRRGGMDISSTIREFSDNLNLINNSLKDLLQGSVKESMDELARTLIENGVPEELAYRIAGMSAMFSALDIVEAANANKLSVNDVATTYFAIGARLEFGWFREQIKRHPIRHHWEALARAAFRDDVDKQQRNLVVAIMTNTLKTESCNEKVDHWLKNNESLVKRWQYFIGELKGIKNPDYTMFAVALRELLDITQVLTHSGAGSRGD